MIKTIVKVIDFMLPPVCPVCNRNVIDPGKELVCRDCYYQMSFDFVDIGYRRRLGLADVYFPLRYSDRVKGLMKLFKFENFTSIGKFFANAMYNKVLSEGLEFDIITYIPSHPARIREKGSYPTKYLAKEISRLSGKPVEKLLKATRYRSSQTGARDRRRNVEGAFEALMEGNPQERILLIDDVITTGATMMEAIMELRRAGFRNITGLTAAGKPE